jgi:hypothetical protein
MYRENKRPILAFSCIPTLYSSVQSHVYAELHCIQKLPKIYDFRSLEIYFTLLYLDIFKGTYEYQEVVNKC